MKFREFLGKLNQLDDVKITARFISKLFEITLPHAHQDLSRLYRMGFVSRRRDPEDGRRFIYRVNRKGKKYLKYLRSGYYLWDRYNLRKLYSAIDKERLPNMTKTWWKVKGGEKVIGKIVCPSLIPLNFIEMCFAEKTMDEAKVTPKVTPTLNDKMMFDIAIGLIEIKDEYIAKLNERIHVLEEFIEIIVYGSEEV